MAMKNFFQTILLCLLFFSSSVQAHVPQGASPELMKIAEEGRDLILNRQYQKAEKLFKDLEIKHPQSPIGVFGQISILQTRMFENFDFRFQNQFKSLAEKNSRIIKALLKDENASAWDLYLAGASHGVMSFYYIRTDQLFKAIDAARRSQNALKKAIQKDPLFYDPHFGVGMHMYWRSVYTHKFKFLPFFKDQREEGIQKMKLAIAKGSIGKPLSMAGLIFVYWNSKRYAQGLKVAQALEGMYPQSAITKMLAGNMMISMRQYDKAIALFEKMKVETPEIYISHYFLAYCFYKKRQYPLAEKTFAHFLTFKPAPAWHAYTLYNLGHIDLHFKRRKEAFQKFKQGSRIYSKFSGNLKALKKMRQKP